MAEAKTKTSENVAGKPERELGADAPPIDEATDGGSKSRLEKGIKDNPDKPSPSTVAQIQELHDEEPGG